MKLEWKKHMRELYGVKDKPVIVTVPRQNYIMIKGKGNPNNEEFSEQVGVLYSLAYPIKMQFKAMCKCDKEQQFEYSEYSIFPLEGLWSTNNSNNLQDKDSFHYTIMIRQPDFITKEMFQDVYKAVEKKKPHPFLREVVFDSMEDGLSIQMLHRGSFDNEPESFMKMHSFAKENGLERINHLHREIYFNDARKTIPDKRQTILRFQVK